MAPKASSKAKLIFSPQKRQRKTVVPSADKLEVFIIRYSEKAQLVSEAFDEDQACYQIDVTHGGKPSMLYRLKDHFLEFLRSESVEDLPKTMDDLAACRVGELKAASKGRLSDGVACCLRQRRTKCACASARTRTTIGSLVYSQWKPMCFSL